MKGLDYVQNVSQENKFTFNGQTEKETKLNLHWHETAFRSYDPQLGRFHQIDPLADLFTGINPYQFGYNNLILFNDPTGLVAAPSGTNRINSLINDDDISAGLRAQTKPSGKLNLSAVKTESKTKQKGENKNDWQPLNALKFDELSGKNKDESGFVLENVWSRWAESSTSFTSLGYERQSSDDKYPAPDWNRKVAFDGKSKGYDVSYFDPKGKGSIDVNIGIALYEVKRIERAILYKNYKNIGAEVDAISHNWRKETSKRASFYYLITTADVTNVSDITNYAETKNVNFGHYVPYYKITESNIIMIMFKARVEVWMLGFYLGYNDFDVLGGNKNGVKIYP
ncbi:RHS repeat-associated core domain-containing protein [Thermoflexibacter ruber]|uniref:RHS repeat-associated core domain-containing protein n=1 Tax=Thermoflexibacter ruber TaxID=1003 RepID=A0A1I2JXB0_9BACT|nr:RHS repeat-associated core domain-containing protein [Thermoflexibacter ruber]SFF57471.1 RHS repeat-associated core domain-containing protein [Thermoflexibacter ruber]